MSLHPAWKRSTDAVIEPATAAEAKLHCGIASSVTTYDAMITRHIKASRMQIEDYLGAGLITQTWTYQQARFTDVIRLPMAAPLQSVTAVQYYDTAGSLQTLATTVYTVDTVSEPGRILLAPDQSWPAIQDRPDGILITYVVGVTAAAAVRADIVDALMLLVGHRHEHREAASDARMVDLPQGVESILAPLRTWWYPPKDDAA